MSFLSGRLSVMLIAMELACLRTISGSVAAQNATPATLPPAQAQSEQTPAAQTSAAASTSQEIEALLAGKNGAAQRKLGERLVKGYDIVQDKVNGNKLLEAAVANGDVQAMAILGSMLLDGYYLPPEPTKALRLLEAAATEGNGKAESALGTAYLWGLHVKPDSKRALGFLSAAAEQGDRDAQRTLGEQLVLGIVFPADQTKGLALLEAALAAGDKKSRIRLGVVLLNGEIGKANETRALELFEAAAADGDGEGLQRYGEYLLTRKGRWRSAERYLRRAGELGRGAAWTDLAQAALYKQLGKYSLAKYDDYAKRARAAGETRLAMLDAQRMIWGLGTPMNAKGALSKLEKAARNGNTDAAVFLIETVRDGNTYNIRRSPEKAAAYIEEFKSLLTPVLLAQQRMMIRVVQGVSQQAFGRVAASIAENPNLMTSSFAKTLFKKNQRLAVYLLQVGLKKQGMFEGKATGSRSKATTAAAVAFCQELPASYGCTSTSVDADMVATLLPRLQTK